MSLDLKNILIIGGTGTIGSSLLKKLLNLNIKHIYVLSRDEQKQDMLLKRLNYNSKVTFIVGDIRNFDKLNSIMKGIDIVFHTAAMKIVRICEMNPHEAYYTNIIGTENVIRSSISNNVEKVIFTSTDKAANPTSVMGISKLYSERLISNANFLPNSNTIFSSVRFGNVLGSRGCVLDLFINQIKNNKYVTVTDPDMSRFILSIDEAVDFLLKSINISIGGEVLIQKMPCIRIYDLAEALIEHFAPIFSRDPKDIKIKIIGKQSVEKIHEELVSIDEITRTLEFDNNYCILPAINMDKWENFNFSKSNKVTKSIASNNTDTFLTKKEIVSFLLDKKLI